MALTDVNLQVRNELLRGSLAILLGCLAPAALFVLLPLGGHDPVDPKGLPFLAFLATLFAFAGVVVVGLPVHAFLRHKNWTGYRHYIAAGIISGVTLSLLGSGARDHGPYWLNFSAMCPFTVASAIGLRIGWGKS